MANQVTLSDEVIKKNKIQRKSSSSVILPSGATSNGSSISNSPNNVQLTLNVSGDQKAPLRAVDNIKGLTIVVDFSDEPQSIDIAEIDDYLNLKGYTGFGNNGSIRDYFGDVSMAEVDYTNDLMTVYYRAPEPRSYYEADDSLSRARELISDAIDWVEASGYDFSTLTTYEESGYEIVSAISILYAGEINYGGLWPHKGGINFKLLDGVYVIGYQLSQIGNELTLGAFAHEAGHMLFNWPDLYDGDYDSFGVGSYDLMSDHIDDKNPLPPSVYLREKAGWISMNEMYAEKTDHSLKCNNPVQQDPTSHSPHWYGTKLVNPQNRQEAYYFECRTKTGRNAALLDEGLMIWHVDANVTRDNISSENAHQDMTCEKHYQVSLIQADGDFDLENNVKPPYQSAMGDDTDLFDANSFDSVSNFNWWCDTGETGLDISNISAIGENMTFETAPRLDNPAVRGLSVGRVFGIDGNKIYFDGVSGLPTVFYYTYHIYRSETINGVYEELGTSTLIDPCPYGGCGPGPGNYIMDEDADPSKTYFYKVMHLRHDKTSYFTPPVMVKGIPNNLVQRFDEFYVRGTNNSWGSSAMTLIDHNTWEIIANFESGVDDRFKFDRYGNWLENYGDDNSDGNLEAAGNDILISEGTGNYRITVNDQTLDYSVVKLGTENIAPIANAGDDITIKAGEMVHFDASGSYDTDGSIARYHWYNGIEGITGTKVYDIPGVYTVNLMVTDNLGENAFDARTITVNPNNQGGLKRTVIYIYGETSSGQDMFLRGGLDHDYANYELGRNCSTINFECALPIQFLNTKSGTTAPWKAGDSHLDWYGSESTQSNAAEGSAMDWTTNYWPTDWGTTPYYNAVGYGQDPENSFGMHFWKLDVMMDCSKAVDGWFEVKSYISNGPGWEGAIDQGTSHGEPYASGNHFAQCGKKNVFFRDWVEVSGKGWSGPNDVIFEEL